MEIAGIDIQCVPTADATPEQVANSHVFLQWFNRLTDEGFRVQSVRIHATHWWGQPREIKMIHLEVSLTDSEGRHHNDLTTLRGQTVDVLAIVTTPGSRNEYLVLVVQPRPAGAQAAVASNPSGMREGKEAVYSATLRELDEELGEKIPWCRPIELVPPFVDTTDPLLVSPGGSDELVWMLKVRAEIGEEQLARLRFKFAGAADESEHTQVLVVPFEDVPRRLASIGRHADAKTLLSYLLYERSVERQQRIRL